MKLLKIIDTIMSAVLLIGGIAAVVFLIYCAAVMTLPLITKFLCLVLAALFMKIVILGIEETLGE